MSRLGPPYHIVSGNVSENARNQMSVKQHVLNEMLLSFLCFHSFIVDQTRLEISHLHPSAHGQAIIFKIVRGIFSSEISILAAVSDTSVDYQAVNMVKRWKTKITGRK